MYLGLLGPSILLVLIGSPILVCAGTPLLGCVIWIPGTSRAGAAFSRIHLRGDSHATVQIPPYESILFVGSFCLALVSLYVARPCFSSVESDCFVAPKEAFWDAIVFCNDSPFSPIMSNRPRVSCRAMCFMDAFVPRAS